jgi:hypothetical protein
MNHEFLMQITAAMPMKTIQVNGQDYLERYFAGYADGGGQWWLHHFLRADSEEHLHTHAFKANAVVLCGGYTEQYRHYGSPPESTRTRYLKAGYTNEINEAHLHRIISVMPDTWTLLHVSPGRLDSWRFVDDDLQEVLVQSSGENWHLSFGPREIGMGCE